MQNKSIFQVLIGYNALPNIGRNHNGLFCLV